MATWAFVELVSRFSVKAPLLALSVTHDPPFCTSGSHALIDVDVALGSVTMLWLDSWGGTDGGGCCNTHEGFVFCRI